MEKRLVGMREQSHLDAMREAVRGDIERAKERRPSIFERPAPPPVEIRQERPAQPAPAPVSAPVAEPDPEAYPEPETRPEPEPLLEPQGRPFPEPLAEAPRPRPKPRWAFWRR